MASQHISATVDRDLYQEFEMLRVKAGQKRSEAVEEAIRLWLKNWNDALIAEGCKASREEDLALAKASRRIVQKALARNL